MKDDWIETKKELPKGKLGKTDEVIVYNKDIGRKIGWFIFANGKWVINGVAFYKDEVTHWQPLPEKPNSARQV